MMSRTTTGRILLSLVALVTATGAFLADFNTTHIYNPNWPPHARFHTGQTMSMAAMLGLTTLYFVWRRRGDWRTNLRAAGVLVALYWITQIAAFAYPGVAYADPEFINGPPAKVPPQIIVGLGLLTIAATGIALIASGHKRRARSAVTCATGTSQ